MNRKGHCTRPALAGVRAILAGLVLSVVAPHSAPPVLAAARVEGAIDSVTVAARDATLAEVFSALSARVGVQIRMSRPSDQRVNGSFRGPLPWVLARLLAGHNYIARYSDGAIDIVVVGPAGSPPNAAAAAAAPPALVLAGRGRRTRNEAVFAAARAALRTTGAADGEPDSTPRE